MTAAGRAARLFAAVPAGRAAGRATESPAVAEMDATAATTATAAATAATATATATTAASSQPAAALVAAIAVPKVGPAARAAFAATGNQVAARRGARRRCAAGRAPATARVTLPHRRPGNRQNGQHRHDATNRSHRKTPEGHFPRLASADHSLVTATGKPCPTNERKANADVAFSPNFPAGLFGNVAQLVAGTGSCAKDQRLGKMLLFCHLGRAARMPDETIVGEVPCRRSGVDFPRPSAQNLGRWRR